MNERHAFTEQGASDEEARLAIGMEITRRVRQSANDTFGGWTDEDDLPQPFDELYLQPRELSLPDNYIGEEPSRDVWSAFFTVFDEVRYELEHRLGRDEGVWVYVDAAIDADTTAILCTDRSVLSLYTSPPWAFTWQSESEMAASLGVIYEGATERLLAERRTRGPNPYGTST